MPNKQALKLPDQLLVRYYRQGTIDVVKRVVEKTRTRDIVVSLHDGTIERWKYLKDLGWIPQQ